MDRYPKDEPTGKNLVSKNRSSSHSREKLEKPVRGWVASTPLAIGGLKYYVQTNINSYSFILQRMKLPATCIQSFVAFMPNKLGETDGSFLKRGDFKVSYLKFGER